MTLQQEFCGAPLYREAKMILLLSDARGQYIPRDFAIEVKRECISGVDMADLDYLARGPDDVEATEDEPAHDAEMYWDVWSDVELRAIVTDPDSGIKYRVYQDGDCWLVEDGAELNEDHERTGLDCMFVVELPEDKS